MFDICVSYLQEGDNVIMRAALYIDCDSVEARCVPAIYEEILRTDKLVAGKMFNSNRNDRSFQNVSERYRLQDCMQGGYTVSTAMVALAVEVMVDEAAGVVDRVYIATGDPLAVPLLDKLKLTGTSTVVLGPCNADRVLVESSQRYVYLDVLMGDGCTADILDRAEVAREVYTVSSYYKGMGQDATLAQISASIGRKHPDFDVRNYGYAHLAIFIKDNVAGADVYTDEAGVSRVNIFSDRTDIDAFAYEYMTGRGYKIDDMAELLDALQERFPGFAMENYGYHTDYGFILSFPKFEIWENKGVKMKRTFRLSADGEEKD